MSTPAPHTPSSNPGTPAAGTHRHSQALDALVEIGTGFARLLHAQALAQPAPQPATADPALAANSLVSLAETFDKVARAVRRCVALAQRLDAAPPAPNPARHRTTARKRILRDVEDTIQRTAGHGPDTPEALRTELRDRLDSPDLEDDITTRPIEDIVEEICRDLGLAAHPGTRPFERRTPADVAQLCAKAAAPSAARRSAPQDASPGQPGTDAVQPFAVHPLDHREPGPTPPGATLPANPADAVALILRHQTQDRWRPPFG